MYKSFPSTLAAIVTFAALTRQHASYRGEHRLPVTAHLARHPRTTSSASQCHMRFMARDHLVSATAGRRPPSASPAGPSCPAYSHMVSSFSLRCACRPRRWRLCTAEGAMICFEFFHSAGGSTWRASVPAAVSSPSVYLCSVVTFR